MSPIQSIKLKSTKDLAAAGLYLALLFVALWLIWGALAGIGEQRASLSAAETMLAQLEGRSLSSANDSSPMGGAPAGSPFLVGQNLNVAGAALLQRVAAAVEHNGGSLVSSQVNLDNPRAKEGWIELIVSCDIDQTSLQPLLYNVESGMPFLFIDQLVVDSHPTSGQAQGGRMRVLMTVSGQWWKGA